MACCCVPFCKSKRKKGNGDGPKLSFHEFPVNRETSEQWLTVISRKDFAPNTNSASSVVCGLHFKEDDYSFVGKSRRLKPQAIPSIFPGYPHYKVPVSKLPRRSLKKYDFPPPKIKRLKTLDVPAEETLGECEETRVCSCDKAIQTNESSITRSCVKQTLNRLRVKTSRFNKAMKTKQAKLDESLHKLKCIESSKVYNALQRVEEAGDAGDLRAKFILEQLLNFAKKRPTWSDDIVSECVVLQYLSPNSYNHIRKSGILLLPQLSTLKRFVGAANSAADISTIIKEKIMPEATALTTEEEFSSLNFQKNSSDHCYCVMQLPVGSATY